MLYCMSSRQQEKNRELADQLRLRTADIEVLMEFAVKYPNKTIIYEVGLSDFETDVNAAVYQGFNNIVFELASLNNVSWYQENGYKWFWKYPATSYFELDNLIRLNPAYIVLGAPLTFDLKRVSTKTDIPLRMFAIGGAERYIPTENGICNSWVRPEDVEIYDKYIAVFDFLTDNLTKETTYVHIYKEQGNWPGNLNLLIPKLGINVDNRAIPDDFGETRSTCKQRCMINGSCHYCENAIKFSNAIRNLHYERLKEESLSQS